MPPADFLAMKFTSKTMYTLTKNAVGEDLINVQKNFNKRTYAAIVIKLERELLFRKRKKTMVMTCSNCAKLRDNSVEGFCDREFQRTRKRRYCRAKGCLRRRPRAGCVYDSLLHVSQCGTGLGTGSR